MEHPDELATLSESQLETPKDQLLRMLEQTLVPPTAVVELDPTTVEAATNRWGSAEGNLAESYQLNSSLTPNAMRRLAGVDAAQQIAEFYFTTTTDAYRGLVADGVRWARPAGDWPEWVDAVVGPCWRHPAVASALYSVDVLLVLDGDLWRVVPGSPGLIFEGAWTAEHDAAVRSALAKPLPDSAEVSLFVVGHVARASYLTGDRAFRNAALGSGLVLGSMWLSAQQAQLPMVTAYEFVDRVVNDAVRCDGVERGVLAVVALAPQPSAANGNEAENEGSAA